MYKKLLGAVLVAGAVLTFGATAVGAEEVKEDGKVFHVVEAGDTLSEISGKYNLSYLVVQGNNDIVNPDLIHVGSKFLVGGEGFDKNKVGTVAVQAVEATEEVAPVSEQVVQEAPVEQEVVAQEVVAEQPVVASSNDGSPQYAAERMASATGTSVSTWLYIIEAESGNNPHIVNSIGCYGYFQIHPVHGMPNGASVDTQIQYAIGVYNSQGFGAWEVM